MLNERQGETDEKCYKANMKLMCERLCLPPSCIERVADDLAKRPLLKPATTSVEFILRKHVLYFQRAVEVETGEKLINWDQPHGQIRAHGKPGFMFSPEQAWKRVPPSVKTSMALAASVYSERPVDRVNGMRLLGALTGKVEVSSVQGKNLVRLPAPLIETYEAHLYSKQRKEHDKRRTRYVAHEFARCRAVSADRVPVLPWYGRFRAYDFAGSFQRSVDSLARELVR